MSYVQKRFRVYSKSKRSVAEIDSTIFTNYTVMFQKTVFRVAYSFVKNCADAEDITQEAFLKLYKSSESFNSDENVKAWLIRVTSNIAKNHLSSAWYRRKAALTDDIALKSEEDYALLEALNALDKNYRTVIYLHYYEGYSVKEAASLLGISESNAKARLKRGRDKLREILTDEE